MRIAGFLSVLSGAGTMLWILGPRLALLPMFLLAGPAAAVGPLLKYGNEGLAAILPATLGAAHGEMVAPGATLTLAGFVLCCVLVLTLLWRRRLLASAYAWPVRDHQHC